MANLELLEEKNIAEMRSNFLENENIIKKRLHLIFGILNERGSFNKSEAREYEEEGRNRRIHSLSQDSK